MSWQGDFAPGTTVNFTFTTVNTSGAPTQLSGTPLSRVFQNSLSSSAAAGVTLVSNFASTTGLNNIAIDTSQDIVFYAAGNNYSVVLTAGNVGGTSIVGYTVATFSLNNRSIRANVVSWSSATVSVPNIAGVPKVDIVDINGSAAVTSSAQLGVNIVTWEGAVPAPLAGPGGNLVQTTTSGASNANVTQWLGVAPAPLVNALVQTQVSGTPGVSVTQWNGTPTQDSLPPDYIFIPGQSMVNLQSGSSTTTVTLVSGSSNITDFYKNQIITLKSGLGTGESAIIVNYNPTTKVATINGTWAQPPSGGDGYFLTQQGQAVASLSGITNSNVTQWAGGAVPAPNVTGEPLVDVNHWRGTQPNTLVSNRVDASVGNNQNGVITTTAFAAGALTTSVFAANYFTAALLDATAGNAIADDLLDRANAIETGVTPRQAWRYVAAAEAGVTAGALTTTFTIAAIANNGTNRITATTTASGNRTAVTLN